MLAIVALLSLGVLAGCGGGGAAGTPVTVTMGTNGEMKYDQSALNWENGKTYSVTLKNADTAQAHSFLIPDLNVNSGQVAAGQSKTIEVKASKTGTFTAYCDVPGHKDGGMHMEVTVK